MSFRWQIALFILAMVVVAVAMWQPVIGLTLIVLAAIIAVRVANWRLGRR